MDDHDLMKTYLHEFKIDVENSSIHKPDRPQESKDHHELYFKHIFKNQSRLGIIHHPEPAPDIDILIYEDKENGMKKNVEASETILRINDTSNYTEMLSSSIRELGKILLGYTTYKGSASEAEVLVNSNAVRYIVSSMADVDSNLPVQEAVFWLNEYGVETENVEKLLINKYFIFAASKQLVGAMEVDN